MADLQIRNVGNRLVVVDMALHARRVEPRKRLVAGRFGWAFHRFPIRGGITPMQALQQDACEPSFLSRLLKGRT